MSIFTESFSSDYDKGKEIYDWCFNVVFELFNGFYIKHKDQKTNLFCQAEYGSYESDNRPRLDDTFEKLRLHEILDDDKTDFCRNKSFGKEYIDFEKAFNCLKKVIERIVESQIHQ